MKSSLTRIVLSACLLPLVVGCNNRPNPGVAPASSNDPGSRPHRQPVTVVVVPGKYDGQAVLPVVVMMHGMGSKPEGFLFNEFQELADALRAVIVSPSAPLATFEGGFDWSDDSGQNLARIRSALAEAETKARIRKDRVVLMGYSQGAFAALTTAYRHPEFIAGAIAVSPGSLTKPPLLPPDSPSLLAKRGFVLCYGDQDDPDWIRQAKQWLEAARQDGAKVETKVYAGAGHLVPDDRDEMFPKWFAFVMRANED